MMISKKTVKGDSSHNAGAQGRDRGAKPVSGVVRTLYKWWKYGTIIGVVLGIVLVGVAVLGEVGEEVGEGRRLAALYKGSSGFSQATEGISKLLNSKKSSFISSKVVNLYLSQKINKNDNPSNFETRFADLEHFAEYFLTQRYDDQNFVKFPLTMYERNFLQVVDEPMTSKALRRLKSKVQQFLEKHDLTLNDDVKELKWSRVKKLVESGKFRQVIELLKDNIINWTWQWIGNQAKVTILLMDQSNINKSTPAIIQKNKKLLKKWIQQNEDTTEIIILSKYCINSLYDEDKEDTFKSYQVETGLEKFDKTSFCKYFSKEEQLNEAQCNLMRSNFNSFSQLYRFVRNNNNDNQQQSSNEILLKSSSNNEGVQKVLQKVCQKGHVKYYFYQDQQNANKVLQRNKKAKKSRLDKQMDALLVKFSQLKHFLGINRIKEVYNTLTAGSNGEEDKLTLSEVNSVGLLYDFEHHELRWKNEYERIGYEMRVEKSCKGERFVEDQIKQEENQQKKKKEEKQKEQDQQQVNEEEEQATQQQKQVQQEYEQSPIDYRHDGQEQNEGEQEETEGEAAQLQEQEQQTNGSEQTDEEQEQAGEQGAQEQVDEQGEAVEESQGEEKEEEENLGGEQGQETEQEQEQGETGQQIEEEQQAQEDQEEEVGEETIEQQELQRENDEQQNVQKQNEDQETNNQGEEENLQDNQQEETDAIQDDEKNPLEQQEENNSQQQDQAQAQQQEETQQNEQLNQQETTDQQQTQTAQQDEEQSQNQDQQTQTTQNQQAANQQAQNQQTATETQQEQQAQTELNDQTTNSDEQETAKTQSQEQTDTQATNENDEQDNSNEQAQNNQKASNNQKAQNNQ